MLCVIGFTLVHGIDYVHLVAWHSSVSLWLARCLCVYFHILLRWTSAFQLLFGSLASPAVLLFPMEAFLSSQVFAVCNVHILKVHLTWKLYACLSAFLAVLPVFFLSLLIRLVWHTLRIFLPQHFICILCP